MQKMSQTEELARLLAARARRHTLTPEEIGRAMDEQEYDAAGLDALHAALPFLGGLALFLGLPLALADTAGHEVARFPKAWHNGLPLAAALLTVNEAVCRVYVLVPGQFHTGGCLVDQRPDFCGNRNHTVSSSFTL